MTASTPVPASFASAGLPVEFDESLALYWLRFTEASEATDQTGLLSAAGNRPELAKVWCASDFVAGWCIRHPDAFADLLNTGALDAANSEQDWQQQQQALSDLAIDEVALDRALRAYRQQQMVRIAWRDLSRVADVEETMQSVSRLAEVCLQVSMACHQHWLENRSGVPRSQDGNRAQLVCLGLGKLGGGELNYSSDIDLVFAYDQGGQTDGDKVLDNQTFFTRLVQKIVGSLDRVDAGGFVFRTDLRLRPNGDSGPVALSFVAMEHYYQTHGRDWERYALIKARQVAGEMAAGAALLEMLRPFVYRKYLDYSAFDSIREMKQMIERQLGAGGLEDDVKLGRGGIREIEFLVQNFQLIRGGREQQLRSQSLYRALQVLVDLDLMKAETREQLISAYRFLRNTEHRLQMVADRQTQTLPKTNVEQMRLAVAMGFDNWNGYCETLNHHRDFVQTVFTEALTDPVTDDMDTDLQTWSALWQQQYSSEQMQEILEQKGFVRAQECVTLLTQFYHGNLVRAFATVERQRLDRLMPLVLKETADYRDGFRTVSAFISIVEAIGRRSVYLSLLIENPLALTQLLKLCSASSWIARHIGRHPVVLDELIQPLDSIVAETDEQLTQALEARLAQVEEDDVEGQMNALREFYHARVLRIAGLDVRGIYNVEQIQQSLTQLAQILLSRVLADALAMVERKQGPAPGEIGIIAYGKFAGRELGYHSDLDIVVCFDPAADASATAAEYYFSRVGQKLIHLISTRTQAGILFELDMRLRPSGRSGTLVTSLKGFADYQSGSAWTWEHQALVRARMVIGSEDMRQRFESIRHTILSSPRQRSALVADISSMRDRMREANSQSDAELFDLKLDRGGIVEIEFLLQFLVLSAADRHPEILQPRSTRALIESLSGAQLVTADDGDFLAKTYEQYLRRSLTLKLMDQPLLIPQQELQDQRTRVAQIWQSGFG